MKKTKYFLALAVCVALLALSVFGINLNTTITSTSLAAANRNYTLSYSDVNRQGNTISVETRLRESPMFEVGQGLIVAADPNFTQLLPSQGFTVNGSTVTYHFENISDVDQIYVKSPVLYFPQTIQTVQISSLTPAKLNDLNWFNITSVSQTKRGDQNYVVVEVEPCLTTNRSILPRFPKLLLGNKEIGGSSQLSFDTDMNWIKGIFTFLFLPQLTLIQ